MLHDRDSSLYSEGTTYDVTVHIYPVYGRGFSVWRCNRKTNFCIASSSAPYAGVFTIIYYIPKRSGYVLVYVDMIPISLHAVHFGFLSVDRKKRRAHFCTYICSKFAVSHYMPMWLERALTCWYGMFNFLLAKRAGCGLAIRICTVHCCCLYRKLRRNTSFLSYCTV